GRAAGLSGVEHHGGDARGDVAGESRVIQDDVRAFPAELLGDAFHRGCGVPGDIDACTGRSGEGDHVDVRVAGHRRAHARAVALNQVENAGRNARRVQDLREDLRRVWRELGRLEYHRAARCQRGEDL